MNAWKPTFLLGKPIFGGAMLVSRRVKLHSFLPKPKNNSSNLTSQWKITILNRRYIFKWLLFHHHFSFRGCKTSFGTRPAQKGDFWEMSSRNPKTSAPKFIQLAFVHLAGDAQLAKKQISTVGKRSWTNPYDECQIKKTW